MLTLFWFLPASSIALIIPAWLYSRSRRPTSSWLPCMAVPAIGVWVLLIYLGVGAQSLANVVELPALTALGIVVAYTQVFVLDSRLGSAPRTTWVLTASLVVVAGAMRLVMPSIPE